MNNEIQDNNEMREYISYFVVHKDQVDEISKSEIRVDVPCNGTLMERMVIIGEKFEDELKIIDRGGLSFDVPLGEFDRIYDDNWAVSMKLYGIDCCMENHWYLFHETLLERCLLKRIHSDFQYPLIKYLECNENKSYDGLISQIVHTKNNDPVTFSGWSFSEELREKWDPLVKLLVN